MYYAFILLIYVQSIAKTEVQCTCVCLISTKQLQMPTHDLAEARKNGNIPTKHE